MIVLVFGGDQLDEFALSRFAGNDREVAGLEFFEGLFLDVEPQAGLPFAFVGAMTGIAVLGKDGPYIAIEINP